MSGPLRKRQRIRDCLRWAFGSHLKLGKDDHLAVLVTLLGILVGLFGLAYFTEHPRGSRLWHLGGYTAISVVIVAVMVLVTYATHHRATRVAGTCISILSCVLVCVFGGVALLKYWGERPLNIQVTKYAVLDEDRLPNRLPAIEASAVLSDQNLTDWQMANAASRCLKLMVRWDQEEYREVDLKQARTSQVVSSEAALEPIPAEIHFGVDSREVWVRGMKPGTEYWLGLIYSPAGQDFLDWLKEGDPKRKSELHSKLLDTYRHKIKAIRDKMERQGAIEIEIKP